MQKIETKQKENKKEIKTWIGKEGDIPLVEMEKDHIKKAIGVVLKRINKNYNLKNGYKRQAAFHDNLIIKHAIILEDLMREAKRRKFLKEIDPNGWLGEETIEDFKATLEEIKPSKIENSIKVTDTE